jgi:5'-3' exonuclease
MGVPGFFLWLWKKYKSQNFVFTKDKIPDIDKKYIENIDYFLLDMNCMIHPICFETLASCHKDENYKYDIKRLEKQMMMNVIAYLEKMIDIVQPKKGIYLAIDGVAPVAKMKQQRLRRYKSINDKALFDNIKRKHNKQIPFFWSNSAITPGTDFMIELTKIINEWKETQTLEIIFSSSDEPSEGEHKLLQFIRNNNINNNNYNYMVYGLDADLIFLMLATQLDTIYLMREDNQMENSKGQERMNFVSIRTMKKCIINSMMMIHHHDNNDNDNNDSHENQLVDDFIFICYLMGNDFLPHIPALDIYSNAIDKLLEIYKSISGYIIDRNTLNINNDIFFEFITKLASSEEKDIIESFGEGNRKKKRYCQSTNPYDIEVFKIENMQFKVDDPIMLGCGPMKEWRERFYSHHYFVEPTEIDNFIIKMVKSYYMGLKWVTLYYFDKCPSWDYFYSFDHAPFLNDIIIAGNALHYKPNFESIKFMPSFPLTPYEQLLIVLPKMSAYLLPEPLRKIMTNPNSSAAHLYPNEFKLDMIGKKKYWMCNPILPNLEINLIKKMFEKYKKLI